MEAGPAGLFAASVLVRADIDCVDFERLAEDAVRARARAGLIGIGPPGCLSAMAWPRDSCAGHDHRGASSAGPEGSMFRLRGAERTTAVWYLGEAVTVLADEGPGLGPGPRYCGEG
jgi:hypothetical protein